MRICGTSLRSGKAFRVRTKVDMTVGAPLVTGGGVACDRIRGSDYVNRHCLFSTSVHSRVPLCPLCEIISPQEWTPPFGKMEKIEKNKFLKFEL